jgi:hypothetical protein
MQPKPSFGAAFGAGIGEGIGQTGQMMVNQKLTEMLQQKQLAMQHAEWHNQGQSIANLMTKDPEQRKMIAADIGAVGPDNWMKVMEMFGDTQASRTSGATVPTSKTSAKASKTPQAEQQQFIPGITSPEYAQGQGGQANALAGPQVPNIMGLPNRGVGGQPMPGAGQQMPEPEVTEPRGRQLEQGKYVAPQLTDAEFEASLAGSTNKQKDAARKERDRKIALNIAERKAATGERALAGKEEAREEEKIKEYSKDIETKRDKSFRTGEYLNLMEKAVREGDTDSLVQYWAESRNADPLKSSASSILATVKKELVVDTAKKIGSKGVNQYIEQMTSGMLPTIGRTKENNLQVVETMRYLNDLDIEETRLFDKLRGTVPNEILKSEVYKRLGDFAEVRKEGYAKKLSEIQDEFASNQDLMSLKEPYPGKYLTPARAQALKRRFKGDERKAQDKAIELGYKLPRVEE